MPATPVHVPPWTGKALGAAAALVFAPAHPTTVLWWLTAGIAVGHGFDSLGRHVARPPGGRDHPGDAAGRASLRYTFAALGRLAAASGEVTAQHRHFAERLMARLAFDTERRRQALGWFRAGGDPTFPFDSLATSCRHAFAAHPVLRDLARQSLCRMAAIADTPQATRELLDLGERLGWDRAELAAQAVVASALIVDLDATTRARALLGVGPEDGHDLIRLAYRRRIARWHPDRLPEQAGPEERAAAAHRMCQLRDALDLLTGRK